MSTDAMTEQEQTRLTALRKLIADTARDVSTTDLVPIVLDDETAEKIAAAVIAAGWVQLPRITEHDDLRYWRRLDVQRLGSEIGCDLWNAAAGRHEQARRAAEFACTVAVFSGRPA